MTLVKRLKRLLKVNYRVAIKINITLEQGTEILRVLSELDVTDRAKVLVYATKLKNKK